MGENPSTPPPPTPTPPRQLEYGLDATGGQKQTTGSRLMLVVVWLLGLVSWAIWIAIIIYIFVRFLI